MSKERFEYLKERVHNLQDLADVVGDMIQCAKMEDRSLIHISGDLYDTENDGTRLEKDFFFWYIIDNPEDLIYYTDEVVFYDPELEVYVWAIDDCGTAWNGVPRTIVDKTNDD